MFGKVAQSLLMGCCLESRFPDLAARFITAGVDDDGTEEAEHVKMHSNLLFLLMFLILFSCLFHYI